MRPPEDVIEAAIRKALQSPCAKSKRGVVVFRVSTGVTVGAGSNGRPGILEQAPCTSACREVCGKVAVHAEMRAIREAALYEWFLHSAGAFDALHVKVVDGVLVPSGGPSCWQCSREVLDVGLGGFWLYMDAPPPPGSEIESLPYWRRYTALEFHQETLRACGLEGGL